MGDVSISPMFQGALFLCIFSFPKFRDDLEVLVREGFMKVTGTETCEWLKSRTSLAEYFKWIGHDAEWVPGGFWAPIENAFGIKRHTLRKLAGHNANPNKRYHSNDFKRILVILQPLRAQEKKRQDEREAFECIKRLVLHEAKDGEAETIHLALEGITEIVMRNVDRKEKGRR